MSFQYNRFEPKILFWCSNSFRNQWRRREEARLIRKKKSSAMDRDFNGLGFRFRWVKDKWFGVWLEIFLSRLSFFFLTSVKVMTTFEVFDLPLKS